MEWLQGIWIAVFRTEFKSQYSKVWHLLRMPCKSNNHSILIRCKTTMLGRKPKQHLIKLIFEILWWMQLIAEKYMRNALNEFIDVEKPLSNRLKLQLRYWLSNLNSSLRKIVISWSIFRFFSYDSNRTCNYGILIIIYDNVG